MRTTRRFTFTADGTKAVPIGNQVVSNRVAVYARRVSGAGTATLAVLGAFTDDLDDLANEAIQIQAATAMGTGILTPILADGQQPYSHLVLVYDVTGTATYEVFVGAY